ncbi:MAG: succinylglutamate desuccinylase/aspartoacylase family protein [Pseudomonadaceae bacterium]|nr:succinylglutamate desuccinylase/aspartoacylase family protein [Pseudomonadaceae bacterium]
MNQTGIIVIGVAMVVAIGVAARLSPADPVDTQASLAAAQASDLASDNRLRSEPDTSSAVAQPRSEQEDSEQQGSIAGADIPASPNKTVIPNIEPTVTYRTVVPTVAVAATPVQDEPDPADSETGEAEPLPDLGAEPALAVAPVEGTDISTLEILESEVQPGTLAQLKWKPRQNFDGINRPVPVLVARGTEPGPTMCFVAAVHGDELNGIEVVRRVLYEVNPKKLKGTMIGVPIVNLQGFARNSRYLPDRRDLNRYFPGNPRGSAASRLAYSFFNEVLRHCHTLVDLHTGSFHRTNLPQIRANLNNEDVVTLTKGFGSTLVLHSEGPIGTLRRAAVDAGIPAVTFEIGEPMRLQDDQVRHAVKAVFSLLDKFNVYGRRSLWGAPEPVYYQSKWVRADAGGILLSDVELGTRVKIGDVLGTVTDPITNDADDIESPFNGRIIGMAVDQFVMPGYAAYHIGIETEVDAEEFDPQAVDEDAPDFDHAE